jgi:multidrug efflux pump subunit AcrA (membrane-fusion protein)
VSVLRPGSQAPIASGLIVRRDAQLDPRTRLGRIYIALDGDSALPVGEFVSVRAEGEIVEGALQLPSTALSGRDSVFVLSGGRLARRQVSILAEADGQLMLAPFDIAEGVIVLPPPEAVEGMEVRVLAPEPAADATAARELANGL